MHCVFFDIDFDTRIPSHTLSAFTLCILTHPYAVSICVMGAPRPLHVCSPVYLQNNSLILTNHAVNICVVVASLPLHICSQSIYEYQCI